MVSSFECESCTSELCSRRLILEAAARDTETDALFFAIKLFLVRLGILFALKFRSEVIAAV